MKCLFLKERTPSAMSLLKHQFTFQLYSCRELSAVGILVDFMSESKANKANVGDEKSPGEKSVPFILLCTLFQKLFSIFQNVASYTTYTVRSSRMYVYLKLNLLKRVRSQFVLKLSSRKSSPELLETT